VELGVEGMAGGGVADQFALIRGGVLEPHELEGAVAVPAAEPPGCDDADPAVAVEQDDQPGTGGLAFRWRHGAGSRADQLTQNSLPSGSCITT
jgi:hypothetical protein